MVSGRDRHRARRPHDASSFFVARVRPTLVLSSYINCLMLFQPFFLMPFTLVGNRRFRETIDRNLDRYLQVRSRREKSIIVSEIVGTIRSVSNAMMSLSGGGFVRKVRTTV